MSTLTISRQTARRLILGTHGLWPGRRYISPAQLPHAIEASGMIQIDPVTTLHRNHDLVLHSRVESYQPGHLDTLLHQDRQFFDFGAILHVYPSSELPYWQPIMQRFWQRGTSWSQVEHGVLEYTLNAIAERGPMASREFTEREKRSGGFNSVKDTSIALYRLFLSGKLMSHSRKNADRIYDLAERIYPELAFSTVSDEECVIYFAGKTARELALFSKSEWARRMIVFTRRTMPGEDSATQFKRMLENDELQPIKIEGGKDQRFIPAGLVTLVEALENGDVPEAWKPIASDRKEEVAFLGPLDNTIWDRKRASTIFDFDYVWEVYHAPAKLRWGRYVLPILWGDRLVARMDARIDRKAKVLHVNGFWPEQEDLASNADFKEALVKGFRRLAEFHGEAAVNAQAVHRKWRTPLESATKKRKQRASKPVTQLKD